MTLGIYDSVQIKVKIMVFENVRKTKTSKLIHRCVHSFIPYTCKFGQKISKWCGGWRILVRFSDRFSIQLVFLDVFFSHIPNLTFKIFISDLQQVWKSTKNDHLHQK